MADLNDKTKSKGNSNDINKSNLYEINSKLCKLIQTYPCMYDNTSPNYLKKEFVDAAWEEISRELNSTVASCKDRWNNIRRSYARYLSRLSTVPKGQKRHYLHDDLEFLRKHISPGLRILTPSELLHKHDSSTTPQIVEASSDGSCAFEIIELESPPASVSENNHQEKHDAIAFSETEVEREPEPEIEIEPEAEKEHNCSELNSPAKKRRRYIREKSPTSTVSKPQVRDLDNEFLQSILPEMKSMNSRQKILFKAKMFQVLEEVFNDFKDFPRNTAQSSCSVRSYGKRTWVEKSSTSGVTHSNGSQNRSDYNETDD